MGECVKMERHQVCAEQSGVVWLSVTTPVLLDSCPQAAGLLLGRTWEIVAADNALTRVEF